MSEIYTDNYTSLELLEIAALDHELDYLTDKLADLFDARQSLAACTDPVHRALLEARYREVLELQIDLEAKDSEFSLSAAIFKSIINGLIKLAKKFSRFLMKYFSLINRKRKQTQLLAVEISSNIHKYTMEQPKVPFSKRMRPLLKDGDVLAGPELTKFLSTDIEALNMKAFKSSIMIDLRIALKAIETNVAQPELLAAIQVLDDSFFKILKMQYGAKRLTKNDKTFAVIGIQDSPQKLVSSRPTTKATAADSFLEFTSVKMPRTVSGLSTQEASAVASLVHSSFSRILDEKHDYELDDTVAALVSDLKSEDLSGPQTDALKSIVKYLKASRKFIKTAIDYEYNVHTAALILINESKKKWIPL